MRKTTHAQAVDFKVDCFKRSIDSWFGAWLDGDWETTAFLGEHPANPYLVKWGWWDA